LERRRLDKLKDSVAKCGANCSICPWSRTVRETMKTNEEYRQFREKCKEVLGFSPTDNAYTNCVGCQTPDKERPKEAKIPRLSCLIRQCVDKMGIKNCAYCSRFPCGQIKEVGTLWSREKIEKKHGKPISEEEFQMFVEPFEGLKHLQVIRASLKPEEIVEVATLTFTPKIIEFPKNLSCSTEEKAAYKALHQLLATIKRSPLGLMDTDTFPQQQRLKDRTLQFLRFLWILGCYGEFKKEDGAYIEIDAKKFMDNRGNEKALAYQWLVKQTIFRILQEFRVHCEIVPAKGLKEEDLVTGMGGLRSKGWTMKLSLEEHAGGEAVLKALQTYTKRLEKKYGNKGFKYFTDADMQVLIED